MHNSWLRRSQVVQNFLKQHGIKGKRTIQDGKFSCVLILSRQKVLKVTVDVCGYMLYLHLIKKASINVPKLHKDHGCIGYVTNPKCSDHQLPVVAYEMENIPQSKLYYNLDKVPENVIKLHHKLRYLADSIMEESVESIEAIKRIDSQTAIVLETVRNYAIKMHNFDWAKKVLAKKEIIIDEMIPPHLIFDIHGTNYSFYQNRVILTSMIFKDAALKL